jgi:AcrR family transcriptional regulator
MTEAQARGRPIRPETTQAILRAANELLDEIGYDRLHVQHVADRAKVGLATIYRRWPTKQALIADAVRCRDPLDWVPDTGDVAADLSAGMRYVARSLSDQRAVQFCQGFLASLGVEPEVAEAYSEHVFTRLRGRLRDLVVVAVGEDDPFVELRADLGPALLFYRAQVLRDLGDPDEAGNEVAQLMIRKLDT